MTQMVNKEQQTAVAIIPARYASTRFPGKPLAKETGKFLIQHVYERAAEATRVQRVVVATDDSRIYEAVESFGGEVVMTRADHPNGTSRLAEVVAGLTEGEGDIFVNLQGDEPELAPASIDLAIEALLQNTHADVSTVAVSIDAHSSAANDPNVVKVVCNAAGQALYFSRARIPFYRDGGGGGGGGECQKILKHVGLYVYRRAFLLEYVTWPVTPLEATECLEQLRILENGRRIAVAVLPADGENAVGIDTPEQYAAFVKRYQGSGSK